jgi:alcohol dehydrogenase class IV
MRLRLPRTVLYGRGSAETCVEYLQPGELERVLVMTDENLMKANVGRGLIEALEKRAKEVEVLLRTPGEPKVSEADDIGRKARGFRPTTIVAIGGGATMDTAKIVKILAEHGGSVRQYADSNAVPKSSVTLVVVATTAGTGSETGKAGLVVEDETGEKLPISSPPMYPEIAVVDPDLTLTVPPRVTAATGMDALCQAVGAYLCNPRTLITDVLAKEAIALLAQNVVRAVENGKDTSARSAMAYGSLLSGIAMNNSGAIADQYFDEILGPRYGIPHGMVAGLLMPYVLQYNRTEAEERIATLAELVGTSDHSGSVSEQADSVVLRFAQLAKETKVPSLLEMGVAEEDLDTLAQDVASHFAVDAGLDPRRLTVDGALRILSSAYHDDSPTHMDVD